MSKNAYIYVHAGTTNQFNEYKKQNPELNCVLILDGNTLRGRTPGLVVRIGSHSQKWNAQEIEESIDIHEELWQEQLNNDEIDDGSGQNTLDYGIGE